MFSIFSQNRNSNTRYEILEKLFLYSLKIAIPAHFIKTSKKFFMFLL